MGPEKYISIACLGLCIMFVGEIISLYNFLVDPFLYLEADPKIYQFISIGAVSRCRCNGQPELRFYPGWQLEHHYAGFCHRVDFAHFDWACCEFLAGHTYSGEWMGTVDSKVFCGKRQRRAGRDV